MWTQDEIKKLQEFILKNHRDIRKEIAATDKTVRLGIDWNGKAKMWGRFVNLEDFEKGFGCGELTHPKIPTDVMVKYVRYAISLDEGEILDNPVERWNVSRQ